MSEAVIKNLLPVGESHAVANSISDRLSRELVIALVGPVASGVSTASQLISETLSNKYKYTVAPPIKLSDFIRAEMTRVGKIEPDKKPLGDYIQFMQDAGK
jgi:pantothenate kinase-related protein Tda10